MRKEILYAPMILLLLCSCGTTNKTTMAIQTRYAGIKTAEIEAEVISHLEEEDRTYRLHCDYDAVGASETTVLEPAEIAGLTAVLSGDDLSLRYDDSCLSAGSACDISPADCLPRLMQAIARGYVLAQGEEKIEGTPCRYALFDATGREGKAEYAVWFAKEDESPYYWEISQGNQVILSGSYRTFTAVESETTELGG